MFPFKAINLKNLIRANIKVEIELFTQFIHRAEIPKNKRILEFYMLYAIIIVMVS